jgi:hypothetical protein
VAVGAPITEERIYAGVLRIAARVSVAVLILTFTVYVGGIVGPLVPIEDLPWYWTLSAPEYLAAAKLDNGWGWVRRIHFGDVLNFVGVALLAAATIVCYLRLLPILIRKRDTTYIFIVVAEILILLLAASGVLTGG